MIASFSFTSTCNVTHCSNHLPQQAEILTQRLNITPQWVKNTANDLTRFWRKAG